MSDRYIELGEKKWKTIVEADPRWRESAKGNPYTLYRQHMIVVVQRNFKRDADAGKWQFMITPESYKNSRWEIHGKFDTQEEAQKASLEFLRTPKEKRVRGVVETATPEITEIQHSVRRKIVLGESNAV